MIRPISNINNNFKNIAYKARMDRLQDEIDSYSKKIDSSENSNLSCMAAIILTLLAIGATVATAIKAGKEKGAKQVIENVIQKDTLLNTKNHLNILK